MKSDKYFLASILSLLFVVVTLFYFYQKNSAAENKNQESAIPLDESFIFDSDEHAEIGKGLMPVDIDEGISERDAKGKIFTQEELRDGKMARLQSKDDFVFLTYERIYYEVKAKDTLMGDGVQSDTKLVYYSFDDSGHILPKPKTIDHIIKFPEYPRDPGFINSSPIKLTDLNLDKKDEGFFHVRTQSGNSIWRTYYLVMFDEKQNKYIKRTLPDTVSFSQIAGSTENADIYRATFVGDDISFTPYLEIDFIEGTFYLNRASKFFGGNEGEVKHYGFAYYSLNEDLEIVKITECEHRSLDNLYVARKYCREKSHQKLADFASVKITELN